jgi:transcriptional accessory protein Tex/SPT6
MLQQTRISAAIPYYERFLLTLPDVRALAEVDDEVLMKLWEGLGYYSRARNLKKAAQKVMSDFGGELPRTARELRTLDAERRIENLYKVVYMSRFVGEEFSATVSSVTQFGIFCMLENTCEGLVPMSELGGAFFYDEKNIALRSREGVIRLADTVRIRVEEADIISGKLRFSLVE